MFETRGQRVVAALRTAAQSRTGGIVGKRGMRNEPQGTQRPQRIVPTVSTQFIRGMILSAVMTQLADWRSLHALAAKFSGSEIVHVASGKIVAALPRQFTAQETTT